MRAKHFGYTTDVLIHIITQSWKTFNVQSQNYATSGRLHVKTGRKKRKKKMTFIICFI